MTEPALKLENISKSYGAMTAVRDLSFEAPRGRIFGFLGPNGAGKTSTLRMVLGLVAPTSGRISVLGASDGRRVRDRIGFLPEERGLYARMTVLETIVYFAQLKGMTASDGASAARKLIDRFGLLHLDLLLDLRRFGRLFRRLGLPPKFGGLV